MGLSQQRARSSVRLSLGKQTLQDDVAFAMSVIPETVGRLREISPLYKKQNAV
jgi:cysteine desulfurase